MRTARSAGSGASTSRSRGRSSRRARGPGPSCSLVGVATLASLSLFYTKGVTVKLLPFDNKAELQVVVDLPEGSSVEDTDRALQAIVDRLADDSRGRLVPDLCRHGRAVQLQRPGAPLLSALDSRTGRRAGQPDAEGRARPGEPRHRARDPRAARRARPARGHRRSRWSSRRPGRRCSRRCSPRSTAPTRDAARGRRQGARELSRASPSSSTSTIPSARRPTRVRIGIDQDNLEYYQVEQGDVYDTISALYRRHDGRLLAPRRRAPADPDPHGAVEGRQCRRRARRWRRRCRPTRCPASAPWSSSATSCR